MKKRLILLVLIIFSFAIISIRASTCYDISLPVQVPFVATSNSNFPSLIYGAASYAIAWVDGRNGNNSEIYFERIGNTGIKGNEIRLTNDNAYSESPKLISTSNPSNGFAVVWRDARGRIDGYADLYFARLDADGNKINNDTRITKWTKVCTTNGCKITPAGKVFSPSITLNNYIAPLQYGVAWPDLRNGNLEIYFTRIDNNGNKIGDDVRITNDNAQSNNPSIVSKSGGYAIAWHDGRASNFDIYLAKASLEGVKIGSDIRITNDSSIDANPSLVWNGNGYGIAWDSRVDNNRGIYFARLDADGNKLGNAIRINDDIASSYTPSLTWNGSEYSISWTDEKDGSPKIYFARLDADGNKIKDNLKITNENSPSMAGSSLAWNGNGYGAAFVSYINSLDIVKLTMFKEGACPACLPEGSQQDCVAGNYYTLLNAPPECKGKQICNTGNWSGCDKQPAIEICDNKDNDCDGVIDDGPLNTIQEGVCAESTQKCSEGQFVDNYIWILDYEAIETSCSDGLDNDCDGIIDSGDTDCPIPTTCNECVNCDALACHSTNRGPNEQINCYSDSRTDPDICNAISSAVSCDDFNGDPNVQTICYNNIDSLNCVYDISSGCQEAVIGCGNTICDPGETINNCVIDCGCTLGYPSPVGCGIDPFGTCDGEIPDNICSDTEYCGGCSDCDGLIGYGGCKPDAMCTDTGCSVEYDIVCEEPYNCITDAFPDCIVRWGDVTTIIPPVPIGETENCCLTGECGKLEYNTEGQLVLSQSTPCAVYPDGKSYTEICIDNNDNGEFDEGECETQECTLSLGQKIPFYDYLGALLTLFMLTGYYLFKKKGF